MTGDERRELKLRVSLAAKRRAQRNGRIETLDAKRRNGGNGVHDEAVKGVSSFSGEFWRNAEHTAWVPRRSNGDRSRDVLRVRYVGDGVGDHDADKDLGIDPGSEWGTLEERDDLHDDVSARRTRRAH